MSLSSNQALYDYLVRLARHLNDRGATELSAAAAAASRQAASMSTEFLGESRIALRRILEGEKGVLSAAERSEIENVLRQLTAALNR